MEKKLIDEFNELIMDHDYNPLKHIMKTISRQDIDISNEDLIHNVIFECFEKNVVNQQQAWDNPKNSCDINEIERPIYNKNIQKLPNPVENEHLSFIDPKYWLPNNIKPRELRKDELKNRNISITGWNYNDRDISDIINCFNTIKKIRKENLILFMNFENVLEFVLKLTSIIDNKKCLSADDKAKLNYNENIKEFSSMNIGVKKMIEQLEHLKEANQVSILSNSEFIIRKMADEINFFRRKYKKNYILENDYIHFEDFSKFLNEDTVHNLKIGEQNVNDYYYPDTQPTNFQLNNVLQVRKMEEGYNIFNELNEFIKKNIKTNHDSTKDKKEILKDICSEYSELFQTIIENSQLKSKLEYLDYYKDSFLHINAMTTIHNLTKKNIREICNSKLDIKSLQDEISVNFEKMNTQINQYSAIFETNQLKYPTGYVADLLISSFFNGINYERSTNEKYKDISPENLPWKILKKISKDKKLSLYTFSNESTKTIISTNVDSFILNKKPTIQYNSIFFGFNPNYKNKDNILNIFFNEKIATIHLIFLESIPKDESKLYESSYDIFKHLTDCQLDIKTIFEKTNKIIESVKKGCLNDNSIMIFYYINFCIFDSVLNCTNKYVSAFKWGNNTPTEIEFNERKMKSLEFYLDLDIIELYDSVEKAEKSVYKDLLGFSVLLFNRLFNFDNHYFYVIMNSFLKCFIPLLFSENNTYDLTKLSNYDCFFDDTLGFKQLNNISIEDKLCLKGIKINDCDDVLIDIELETEPEEILLIELNNLRSEINSVINDNEKPPEELIELKMEITYFIEINEIALSLYNNVDDEEMIKSKLKEYSDRFEEIKKLLSSKVNQPEKSELESPVDYKEQLIINLDETNETKKPLRRKIKKLPHREYIDEEPEDERTIFKKSRREEDNEDTIPKTTKKSNLE